MTSVAPGSNPAPVSSPQFPRSLFYVSRVEVDQVPFTVKQGLTDQETQLELGLAGYLFIVGPAGSLDSPWNPHNPCLLAPTWNGYTPLYNGDGMIYRIQFDQGKAYLKTKIARTVSYIADEISHENPYYPDLNFENFGIARNSFYLGASTQLSVTLTPIRFEDNAPYRLLLTVDLGRPYEIDPVSLDIVQPIGSHAQWKPANPLFADFPFQLIMSCAHPSFDFERKELYTVNIGKSIPRFLPTLQQLLQHAPFLRQLLKNITRANATNLLQVPHPKQGPQQFIRKLWHGLIGKDRNPTQPGSVPSTKGIWDWLVQIIEAFDDDDYVELLRWQGGERIDRWKVVLEDGTPLKIQQTLHQLWVTKHFIVLVDTAFKISLEELLPFVHDETISDLEVWFRELADDAQLADTPVYIIRRDDLEQPQQATASPLPTVAARCLTIPREIAHYVVEYDDQDGIVLHTVHSCATDAAETIRHFDRSAFKDPNTPLLAGMLSDGMDINWIGSYVINPNGKDGAYLKPCLIKQDFCWGDPVYAYRNMTLEPSNQIDDMYWIFFGAWEELLSQYVVDLYGPYKYRTVSIEEALKANQEGKAAALCRVHIERQLNTNQELELQLTTPDFYTFPPGYFANSPQFIPRQGSQPGGFTDGYITCLVFAEPKQGTYVKELWIFDATCLQQGPKYRLCSNHLNCGFTIHTTWLPDIAPAPPSSYNVKDDFEPLVTRLIQQYQNSWLPDHHRVAAQLRSLFDQVYQHFNEKQCQPNQPVINRFPKRF